MFYLFSVAQQSKSALVCIIIEVYRPHTVYTHTW